MFSMAEKYIAWFASKKEGRSTLAVFFISWAQCMLFIVLAGAACVLSLFCVVFIMLAPHLLGHWGVIVWLLAVAALPPFIDLIKTKGAGE